MTDCLLETLAPVGDFDWGPAKRLSCRPVIRLLALLITTIAVASAAAAIWWAVVAPPLGTLQVVT